MTARRRIAATAVAMALPLILPLSSEVRATDVDAFVGQAVPHGSGREFVLPDHAGKPTRLADFRGRVVLMFFGFTSCPDVCPTELARLAEVMRLLGPDAARVQVIFVTLDPARDSRELIAKYLGAFSPDFLGLRGSEAETAQIAETFRVFYRRIRGSAPELYTLEHSAYIHVIDPEGRLRLRFTGQMSPGEMASDVRALLNGK